MPPLDPVERDVGFMPTKTAYDPRCMLAGCPSADDPKVWLSGFYDRGSFMEVMAEWAQTVICGRARYVSSRSVVGRAGSHLAPGHVLKERQGSVIVSRITLSERYNPCLAKRLWTACTCLAKRLWTACTCLAKRLWTACTCLAKRLWTACTCLAKRLWTACTCLAKRLWTACTCLAKRLWTACTCLAKRLWTACTCLAKRLWTACTCLAKRLWTACTCRKTGHLICCTVSGVPIIFMADETYLFFIMCVSVLRYCCVGFNALICLLM